MRLVAARYKSCVHDSRPVTEEEQIRAGVRPELIRCSVGIEHIEYVWERGAGARLTDLSRFCSDIVADFEQAFEVSGVNNYLEE